MNQHEIRIGTLAGKGPQTAQYIRQILPHGFESFEINFWEHIGATDLKTVAREVQDVLAADGHKALISCLGLYGNPLMDKQTAKDWARLIDAAPLFGCDLVCGFAGRLVDQPIPNSLKAFRKVFAPLVRRAADNAGPVGSSRRLDRRGRCPVLRPHSVDHQRLTRRFRGAVRPSQSSRMLRLSRIRLGMVRPR